MKNLIFKIGILYCLLVVSKMANSQELEVVGKAKITVMDLDNSENDIVVRQADGTLARRDASTIGGGVGGGTIANAYKQDTMLQVINGNSSATIGLNVTAPADGTYLIMTSIEGIRVGFIPALIFDITVNGTVQLLARRTVAFNTGFRGVITHLYRVALSNGDVVDIKVDNSADSDILNIKNRSIALMKLD